MATALIDASNGSSILTATGLFLAPCAPAGLALLNAGLIRTRSVAHTLFLSLLLFSAGVLVFAVAGFPLSGAGRGVFFHGIPFTDNAAWFEAAWGLLACGFAALIPVGAGSERWRTAGALLSAVFIGVLAFPLFHRAAQYFHVLDAAGAGSIHGIGGLAALSLACVLGPRRGKYSATGMPAATPGHNAAYILFGCFVSLLGFIGLNVAGSSANAAPALVFINTVVSAAGGALASAAVTRVRFGKPDASLCANGWITGLVASSAAASAAMPVAAFLVGVGAGVIVVYAIEVLELRCKIDDPAGAISVHAGGGLWALLTAGVLGKGESMPPQLLAAAFLLGFVFPAAYAFHLLANRFVPYRATQANERQGMDLSELGAGAYPEFMVHRDDFR